MTFDSHNHHHTADYVELCTKSLRDSGARVTQSRLAVIRCLDKAHEPLSPREILEKIEANDTLPNVDQVSVYRILETLLSLGLVHQVSPSGKFTACAHIDCPISLHVLVRCLTCGKTHELDVPEGVMAPLTWYLEHQVRFIPKEHFFQIDGACKDCSKQ
ncbi:MAG: transcriptional repressor [Bdellovibrionales bacterium]|nr:transcriptional repressor [Bdellovibrionales bacterium]